MAPVDTSGSIFICYRREDSIAYAGRLHDHLTAHFGKNRVFMDIDTIQPGEDFIDVLERRVSGCDALIAVIGKEWLTVENEQGQRRLEDPEDYVRREIAAALGRKVRVIPALVGGARMPRSTDMPDDIRSLSRRNAIEISDTAFNVTVTKLIETLEGVIEEERRRKDAAEPAPVPPPRVAQTRDHVTVPRRAVLGAAAGVAALLLAAALVYFRPAPNEPIADAPPAAAPAATQTPVVETPLPAAKPIEKPPDLQPAKVPTPEPAAASSVARPDVRRPRTADVERKAPAPAAPAPAKVEEPEPTPPRQAAAQAPPPATGPVRVGGNIKSPTITKQVQPAYPPIAQSARVQGIVILEVTIAASGRVQEARVLRSIPLLDQAALDAVRQWEFTPTLLNGAAVPVIMTVTVRFALSDAKQAVLNYVDRLEKEGRAFTAADMLRTVFAIDGRDWSPARVFAALRRSVAGASEAQLAQAEKLIQPK